ncbi:hypothetical protein GQ37_022755 [Janthinobacterium sp. BJB1]|uniref:hypothetical protein n=1 Tax=Janthinobacterium sp. GW458P TaxID=1981504 RepID=UPI000A32108C|nr:hypothetical protein [Janthinobacterium sp. GW458P]MBE3026918.1 hypothetical protein [Janthinobacterium sp. GW458P]PHV15986.1 hypothetical protein CSQ90_15885 [Janthinobacterium sp. BJB303]PJC96233.1 hypothetical protein GQ37_022755 [Janthinobacterium sp. BJB1]
MTKMTVVTDENGGLVAAIQGHVLKAKQGDMEGGVLIQKGHLAHQVEVDDDLSKVTDHAEMLRKLHKVIPRS